MLNLKTLANKKTFTKANGEVVVDLIRRAVSFLGIRANTGRAYIVTEETAMRADLISNYFYQDSSYLDLLLKYNGYSNPFSLNTGDVLTIPSAEMLGKFGSVGGSGKLNGSAEILGANGFTSSDGTSNTNGVNGPNGSSRSRTKAVSLILSPKSKKDKARLNYLLQRSNATDANLAKLNVLISSGAIKADAITGKLLSALQGGNFSGTTPSTAAFQIGTAVPVSPNVALDNGVKLQNGRIIFGSDVTNVKKEDCSEPISRTKLKETLIKNKLA